MILFLKGEARNGADKYQHDNHVYFEEEKMYIEGSYQRANAFRK